MRTFMILFLILIFAFNPLPTFAAEQDFGGLKLGIGLSYSFDLGDNDRVEEAQIVDNVVRVLDKDNSNARFMLESHYFFEPNRPFLFDLSEPGNWGIGPFVAVQPGSGEIIEAVGVGMMIGFRRSGNGNSSWNLGIGFVVDPDARILGDGFVENQPPPGSETSVRYKEASQGGLLIISSFSF
ncbi:MAG: hypothetical protein GVY11_07245 [Gammaproteobacteria bacterium]|nr:hypothetical protein [Gammaproteobacteria bacterium]